MTSDESDAERDAANTAPPDLIGIADRDGPVTWVKVHRSQGEAIVTFLDELGVAPSWP